MTFAVSRRRMLQWLGAGTVAMGVPSQPGAVSTQLQTLAWMQGRARAAAACATETRFSRPLPVAGADGEYARVSIGSVPLLLRAGERSGRSGLLGFAYGDPARRIVNPTLLASRGDHLRVAVDNALREPTIVHWHGLAVDTPNDGNGDTLIAPGARFDYAFEIGNRAGLYWYHPHPHGATARQTYLGLFGVLEVEDDEERAVRRALDVTPDDTELTLILQDRRASAAARYAPAPEDAMFGWFGDEPTVNGVAEPYHDVASRHYRLRILNASNARTYCLELRGDNGAILPMLLLGTDGGLVDSALRCNAIFLSPAERIDVLVDFRDLAVGDFAVLQSRAFDPMHAVNGWQADAASSARDGAVDAHGHATSEFAAGASRIAEGAPLPLLAFRVRRSSRTRVGVPIRLSRAPATPATATEARPLRLGFAKNRWRINDRVFDMTQTPIVVARDAVETWLIRNYHTSAPHAMHLHGFAFRVIERETSPEQLSAFAVDANNRLPTDLGWKDTILIWPGESVRVAIDFRHPFSGTQSYLFHCHNLEHEDAGMMLRVSVG